MFQDVRGVGRFGPLKERQFRLLWFARTGSAVGDSLIPVALIWAVGHDLGAGATGVGIVLACYTIGGATVTLAGGVWADRLPRRAVMIGADVVRLGTQATTAVLLFVGTAHVWQLAVLQGIAGAAAGFFNPASKALRRNGSAKLASEADDSRAQDSRTTWSTGWWIPCARSATVANCAIFSGTWKPRVIAPPSFHTRPP